MYRLRGGLLTCCLVLMGIFGACVPTQTGTYKPKEMPAKSPIVREYGPINGFWGFYNTNTGRVGIYNGNGDGGGSTGFCPNPESVVFYTDSKYQAALKALCPNGTINFLGIR